MLARWADIKYTHACTDGELHLEEVEKGDAMMALLPFPTVDSCPVPLTSFPILPPPVRLLWFPSFYSPIGWWVLAGAITPACSAQEPQTFPTLAVLDVCRAEIAVGCRATLYV